MQVLQEAAIFLTAAVVAVPLFKRIGLGSILGYLCAGAIIGPGALGLITDVEDILHFAEFGVVLLLFLIGLELRPARLWLMRKSVFGWGLSQVLLTACLLALMGLLMGWEMRQSVVAGLVLSLSSTAFALQILAEKKLLNTKPGRTGLAILLFQDLAVIPLLALLPLVGTQADAATSGSSWLAVLKVLLVLAGVIFGGRVFLRPVLRLVALTGVHELFSAAALLVVIVTALLMDAVGLSMALGAFLAGVLLADSEYRHELEADINPFKGLLLGLFFIAVGMSVDFGLLTTAPLRVALMTMGLVGLKALVLAALARFAGLSMAGRGTLAASLAQGGEFAFVLFAVATKHQVLEPELIAELIVVVTLSMALTPLLFAANERFHKRKAASQTKDDFDRSEKEENRVIIAGFGRFGQIISRLLQAKKIGFTALDSSQEQVNFVAKFGNKIYYGDPTRLELLRAAQADKAEVIVIAVENAADSLRIVETVQKHFPHLQIFARARGRLHAYQLLEKGVEKLRRETFLSSLELGGDVLCGLGFTYTESRQAMRTFRAYDERIMREQAVHKDDLNKLTETAKCAVAELEKLFEQDRKRDLET